MYYSLTFVLKNGKWIELYILYLIIVSFHAQNLRKVLQGRFLQVKNSVRGYLAGGHGRLPADLGPRLGASDPELFP